MSQLESFISEDFRPEINGGRLDKNHTPKFLLDYSNIINIETKNINTLAFGPKKDKVLLNLEHAITNEDKILILYYEDLHKKWTFVKTNDDTYFLYKQNNLLQYKIKAQCLYIRGCQVDVDDKYWMLLGEFYNFVDCWDKKVVCAPKKQNNNESKLYQLNSSLKESSNNKNVSIGKSYVIKGEGLFKELCHNKSYVVKSLSGIRSIVVDETEFTKWNKKNLNNLPILFQEKVIGKDLRVHIVNKQLYGKISKVKEAVDYRYDSNFSTLEDLNIFTDELKRFCIEVSQNEENPLIGIDFIKTENSYVVLEANPSPGWSAYHQCNGIENDAFIKDLLQELKNV